MKSKAKRSITAFITLTSLLLSLLAPFLIHASSLNPRSQASDGIDEAFERIPAAQALYASASIIRYEDYVAKATELGDGLNVVVGRGIDKSLLKGSDLRIATPSEAERQDNAIAMSWT